ncbi:GAF domain-containing protein [Falsirhodobacter deserti]|uniref:GAF domain-containing protein n=1 Tax=Falsirhodobacter deserti TaxID=1365611 RepID=UPI0019D4E583|nr:GAF domain-containing protein [Falsirhodobacter deserti]
MTATGSTPAAPSTIDCAAEPIRIPGSIQPHGVLVVLDPATHTIIQSSANAGAILSRRDGPLAKALVECGDEVASDLEQDLPFDDAVTLRTLSIAGRLWTVTAHRNDRALIVEFEDTEEDSRTLDVLYPRIRRGIAQMQSMRGVEDLAQTVAKEVRALTGFDRALVYRFDADWNGTVIAEDRNDALPSYLDLRFPASDIPAQARELYRLNRLRLIPDADYTPVPIEPADELDLGFSVLRAVSPVHQEYRRNMGTRSSMSISIVEDGQLW